MKINGRNFNFGRCVRIAFYKNNSQNPEYVLEHKPEIDRRYNVAMDIVVTDMPSASDKDKPGYQATVSIYNPSKQLLDVIISGATWLSDYGVDVNDENAVNQSIQQFKRTKKGAMSRYYNSRVKATIEAGYVVDGKPMYSQLISGFVNGSSFSHKGQDDILTLGIYDFPAAVASIAQLEEYSAAEILDASEEERHQMSLSLYADDKTKFAKTWYKTFVKYIQNYETERIPDDPKTMFDDLLNPDDSGYAPLKKVDVPKSSFITVGVEPKDRQSDKWFNILFVASPTAWYETQVGERNNSSGITDPKLSAKLMEQQMPDGNVTGLNLYQMLDALCALAVVPVGWERIVDNVTMNTYLIYPIGKEETYVPGKQAEIKIWNYQNLLESPSVDGAGNMTVKMVFNPKCSCKVKIALMLDGAIGETDVTRDVASFQSSKAGGARILGSMAAQTSLATMGTTQLNGAQALAAQRKGTEDSYLKGYMFNVGMPIVKVEHRLSTHKADWTTTVRTVPTISGLNYGAKK